MNDRVTSIGNYRVEREIARDGWRVVYQGWQMSLNRPVQITQLTPEATANAELVARWKAVARDLRDPGHPQIPRILDAEFDSAQPYLVESYIVADSLADRIALGQPLAPSLNLLIALAGALAYAHKRGYAHGQLGPEAIRVTEDDSAYLLDMPWQAALRTRGDSAAQMADVVALAMLFCQLRMPVAGPLPTPSGWQGRDEPALAAWLAHGEPAESISLANALAPALLQALTGSLANGEQFVQALRSVQPAAAPAPPPAKPHSGTIMTSPPGMPGRAATPSASVARPPTPPVQAAHPSAPPVVYAAPQPLPGRGSGVMTILLAAVAIAVVAAAAYFLCQAGIIPGCVTCNEGLITQYVSGGRVYVEKQAWGDALRELTAARNECAACKETPAQCSETVALFSQAECAGGIETLLTTGKTLLENGEACSAMTKLNEAVQQAQTCQADESLPRSFLARNSDGGAYTRCAQEQLALAAIESDSNARAQLCAAAFDLLGKARTLKPGATVITQLYARAERYAALQTALEKQQWDTAAQTLDALEPTAENGVYCGDTLNDHRFEILMGQGAQLVNQQQSCPARDLFVKAEALAQTLEQKDRVQKALAAVASACPREPVVTKTGTPTPTPSATSDGNRPSSTSRGVVLRNGINIRTGPGTTYTQVSRDARQGEAFDLQCWWNGQDSNSNLRWYKLTIAGVSQAWIRQDFLQVSGSAPQCSGAPPTLTPRPVTPTPPAPVTQPPPAATCRGQFSLPPVSLAAPPRDKTCNGRVRFSWQTSYGLQSGEVFEIHIWPDYKQRRDKIQQTRSSSVVLDLRRDVPWIDWNNRAHFWEVAVICQANGRWISQESGARLFYFDSRIQVDEGNPDNNCR